MLSFCSRESVADELIETSRPSLGIMVIEEGQELNRNTRMGSPMNAKCCFLVALLFSMGCTPGLRVTKNPGCLDHGIRYYRPKPYLFISPAAAETSTTTSADSTTTTLKNPSPDLVTI